MVDNNEITAYYNSYTIRSFCPITSCEISFMINREKSKMRAAWPWWNREWRIKLYLNINHQSARVDWWKYIDYRGIIITRLNRGRADIADGDMGKWKTRDSTTRRPGVPLRPASCAFRFKKTSMRWSEAFATPATRPARIARIIHNVPRGYMPLCKQHKNSTRVSPRAIGMLSRILPLKSISAMFLTITSRPLSVILPY